MNRNFYCEEIWGFDEDIDYFLVTVMKYLTTRNILGGEIDF